MNLEGGLRPEMKNGCKLNIDQVALCSINQRIRDGKRPFKNKGNTMLVQTIYLIQYPVATVPDAPEEGALL